MRQTIGSFDYTTRDYEGFRSLMLEKLKEKMPEYTDLRQSDAGIVILENNAMCLDILSYYLDSIANECFLATAVQRSNILKYCKMLGYTPRNAKASHYKQVFVKNNSDTEIIIPKGTKVKTYSVNQDSVVYFTTTNDLTIPQGAVGDEKDSKGEYLYAVDVMHGLFINNEELVRLSGNEKNQKYSLNYSPALVDDTFNVFVNDSVSGSVMWTRVNTFAGSSSSSTVYTTEENDYGEISVIFGDDLFGKIPARSQITCSYYVGGGEQGNVGIGAINTMEDNIAGIQTTYNVEQTEIGYDRETIEEIKLNAPNSFRNIWGALTLDDFSGTVKTYFPDVADAQSQRASENWSRYSVDDINIYILTHQEIGLENPNNFYTPIPSEFYSSDSYLRITSGIQDFFNSDTDYVDIENGVLDTGRKIVGTRNINILSPQYAQIELDCVVMARAYYRITEITSNINKYLKRYFSLGNIPFNTDISLQELVYKIIDESGIEGIRYLNLDVTGTKDSQGEIHNDYFDYVNRDLIIPKTGVIIVLKNTHITPKS